MRIVDEGVVENIRYTIFHMNNRFSLKMESELLEQTYKFRDGSISNAQDIKSGLSSEFIKDCMTIFRNMHINKMQILDTQSSQDEEFDTII